MPKFKNANSRGSNPGNQPPQGRKRNRSQNGPGAQKEPVPQFYVGGKYAIENTYIQPMKAFSGSQALLSLLSNDLGKKAETGVGLFSIQCKEMPGKKIPETLYAGGSKSRLILEGEALRESHELMLEIERDIEKERANPGPAAKAMMGYIHFCSKLFDQKHNVTDALYDSPYLDPLVSCSSGMPKILNSKISREEVLDSLGDTIENGKIVSGPLTHLNAFFYQIGELFEREHEKIELNRTASQKDPMIAMAEEKAFLKKLNYNYTALLKSYDALADMVDEKGDSKYDKYMNNPLDQVVGKGIASGKIGNRSPREQIAYIRGCKQAIDNGWGMNELGILGHVELMIKQTWIIKGRLEDGKKQNPPIIPDPEELKRLEELTKDANKLKESVWNLDARSVANKAAVLNQIEAFNEKYRDYNRLQKAVSVITSHNYLKIAKEQINRSLVERQYPVNSKDLKEPVYEEKDGRILYEAGKNGWPAVYMPVMYAYHRLREEVEKKAQNTEDKAFLKWKTEHFDKLRDYVESKQIKEASDILQVIDHLDRFTASGKIGPASGSANEIIKNTLEAEKKNLQICWNKAIGMQLVNPKKLPEAGDKRFENLVSAYVQKRRKEDAAVLEASLKTTTHATEREAMDAKTIGIMNKRQVLQADLENREAERKNALVGKDAGEATNAQILTLLKEQKKRFSATDSEKIVGKYMQNMVKSTMTMKTDPEIMDQNNPDHAAFEKALSQELLLYSKRFLRPAFLDPDRDAAEKRNSVLDQERGIYKLPCKTIAWLLEAGDHESFVKQIKEKAAAKVKMDQIKSIEYSDVMQTALGELRSESGKSIGAQSVKTTISALDAAEKARTELAADIAKKWSAVENPETKKRNSLQIPDSKKLGRFIEKQKAALDKIRETLKGLDDLTKAGYELNEKQQQIQKALRTAGRDGKKLLDKAESLTRKPFSAKHFDSLKNPGYLLDDAMIKKLAQHAPKEAAKPVKSQKEVSDLSVKNRTFRAATL
ncbi:MAG: hypothetical protein K6E18_04590 [Lachnospiraceae bacterium]|nr:hypothetical protein [Lachnospiraceae bacterium]